MMALAQLPRSAILRLGTLTARGGAAILRHGRRRFDDRTRFELEAAELQPHGGPVAGVDEAGRGPLAGPVVAAAVILDPERIPDGIDDSKSAR